MSKSTAAATCGPASEPRPASSAPATKRRPSERSKANRRRPVRAGLLLEGADPVWRPVGEEGSSDDPLLWDRPPLATVIALGTVVAHHKKVAGWHLNRIRQIAERTGRVVSVLVDKRLVLLLERGRGRLGLRTLHEVDPALLDLDPVPRKGDHTLDEVAVRLLGGGLRARVLVARFPRYAALIDRRIRAPRRLEHDDVAAARVAEVRAETVHENPLPDLEGGHHRRARDPERLDEELLDAKGEPDRDADDHDELDHRARRALLALPFALLQRGHDDATRLGAASGAARLGVVGVRLGLGRRAVPITAVRSLGGVCGSIRRAGARLGRIRRLGARLGGPRGVGTLRASVRGRGALVGSIRGRGVFGLGDR